MKSRNRIWFAVVCLATFLLMTAVAQAQDMSGQATNMAGMKFVMVPPAPTCAKVAVASGDPSKGPSVLLLKSATGCVIPWHWHTANENVMIVSGAGSLQMKGGMPVTLTAGGFALAPSQHAHHFKCVRTCTIYLYSDAAFDLHYVDKNGTEIQPADALKAYREKPATEMK